MTEERKTIDELNQDFQDFQDDLTSRESRLRLLVSFTDSMDDLLLLLGDTPTPDFTTKNEL